jgi:hypothetical protein
LEVVKLEKISITLENGAELYNTINLLLSQKLVIGLGTVIPAYNLLHDALRGILDFIAQAKTGDEEVVVLGLSKAKIMVSYLQTKKQVSKDVADILNTILDSIEKAFIERGDVRGIVERSRMLIDALVVCVYRYGKEV